MDSFISSPLLPVETARFARLRETPTLQGGAFSRWHASRITVIGAGNLGSRFAPEAVRSGSFVLIVDPDQGRLENLGTQNVREGMPKVEAVRLACDAIFPGRAEALAVDIRHVGIGKLSEMDVLVDATDDPALTLPLAEISNGLGIPLLRMALDGTGQRELGRVAVSHAGGGHACACCGYTLDDLTGSSGKLANARQPCPGTATSRRQPTLAGGALGAAIAGIALIQAQRLVSGNGAELSFGHELVLDLSAPQLFSIRLPRCEDCVTGHVRWALHRLPRTAEQMSMLDLFGVAEAELGAAAETLEPYRHLLWTTAICGCGARHPAVGGPWSRAPECGTCGASMEWLAGSQRARWTPAEASAAGLGALSLAELGLPTSGAMLVARAPNRPPVRLVLS